MSHCRWVVIAEDSFKELSESKKSVKAAEDGAEDTLPGSTQQSDTASASTPERKHSPTPPPHPPPQPPPHYPATGVKETQVGEKDFSGGHTWSLELPPSFWSIGLKLIEDLKSLGEFSIADDGSISVNGHQIPGYHISEFLRTTCIPHHQGRIPLRLQHWLLDKKMTKFNNHLIHLNSRWKPLYSWKASTLGKRQGHSEALKLSITKRKKRAISK